MLLFVFSTVVLDCGIATDLETLALMSEQIYRQVLSVIVNIIVTESHHQTFCVTTCWLEQEEWAPFVLSSCGTAGQSSPLCWK